MFKLNSGNVFYFLVIFLSAHCEVIVLLRCIESQSPQLSIMARQCIKECPMRVVRKVEFCAGLSYDFGNFRIVHMTNRGEKVMFNLVIKPSKTPSDKWTFLGEIGRCFDLMNGPTVFHVAIVVRTFKIFHVFPNMCGLCGQCQYDSTDEMMHEKTSNCMSIAKLRYIDWQQKCSGPIQ